MFATPTNTVLLLVNGVGHVTAVDLDHRIAGRRAIQGDRAGDQPYWLTLADNNLIVGWGDIYAAPLRGGASRHLATASEYVPAAEPGQIWVLVDTPNPPGTFEVQRIDVSTGTVTAQGIDRSD